MTGKCRIDNGYLMTIDEYLLRLMMDDDGLGLDIWMMIEVQFVHRGQYVKLLTNGTQGAHG